MNTVESKIVTKQLRTRSVLAFSLSELVGVLAVMSVLFSIVVPLLSATIDRAASETEEERLEEFANGFVDYVTAFRSLPGTNDWASAIGGRLERRIEEVLVNDRGNGRAFLVDPNFRDGASPGVPASQRVLGWSQPTSPRFMILSSLGKPLPSGPYDFEELWLGPSGGIMSTNAPWSAWDGKWEDVIIQRIHLGGELHRLVLNNDNSASVADFSSDGGGGRSGGALTIAEKRSDIVVLASTGILAGNCSVYRREVGWHSAILKGLRARVARTGTIGDDVSDWRLVL